MLDFRSFFGVSSCLVVVFLSTVGSSQTDKKDGSQWLLPIPEVDASEDVPDSESVLRYRWGDDISSHFQIETYLAALAKAAPNRTKLVQYGHSYEGRSLNYLVISSAANIAKLDEIQAGNLKISDPRSLSREDFKVLVATQPAIVWLAYCVHGNEISPSDAALLTAYHLLADQREETKQLLEQLVVIVDPLQNPDGRDRFVNVFRESRGRFNQSNPYSNEHTERWPSGRSNHYWFDMNRDWFRHSQQEVKAKVAAYLDWQPQIYVDAHEMGRNSTFYFPPPTDPKNPYLLPQQHEWFSRLGKHQAGWFDKYGFGYMTREVFDAFYPGYGSEWPTLQGGLGILWEQASARGLLIDRDDETQLTYRDGIRNHYLSGLATLEFAAANKAELLESFYQAKSKAIELGKEGTVSDFFLLTGKRPQRAERLAKMLNRNGIEIRELSESLAINCVDIAGNVERERTIPAGSYHIPVAQPTGRLIRALLDRQVDMDDKFLRRQLERNQLRLPDEIYDVTAWSMPLAFDVTCFASKTSVAIKSELIDFAESSAKVDLANAKVAYLIPGTDGAMQAVASFVQNGLRVHVSDETFKINGRKFGRGTIIVKVANNPDDLNSRIQQAMLDFGIEAFATDTAFVEEGAHMGGPNVRWVRPAKILIVVNRPTNYSSGHTWHLLDQFMQYPSTRIKGSDFDRVDLSKFNTIVLPDGQYGDSTGFNERRSKKLQEWMAKGGTLITLRGATAWAASENIALLKNRIVKRKVPSAAPNDENAKPELVSPDNVPGAFFKTNVFQKHWVTFGAGEKLDVFYSGRTILAPTSETGGRALVTFAEVDDLLTSGFCWPTSIELMSETPFVFYRPVGQGHIIAFVDDPNFRAMYPSLQRLFLNAAMFGAGH